MADYGLKISKPFFDVNTASDEDLIFSSSWPSLPIIKEVSLTAAELAANSNTYQHNIGYPAFFSVWQKGYNTALPDQWTRVGTRLGDVGINDTEIVVQQLDTHIKFHPIDISVAKDYPTIEGSSDPASYDPDYGLKIVKEDKSIDSTDLRDYILHTRAQSPLIRTIVRSTADTTTLELFDESKAAVYREPSSNLSWVFGFAVDGSGYWRILPILAAGGRNLDISIVGSERVYMATDVFNMDASIVVLRDPMFASTDSEVTY